jgi:hypothetical protein
MAGSESAYAFELSQPIEREGTMAHANAVVGHADDVSVRRAAVRMAVLTSADAPAADSVTPSPDLLTTESVLALQRRAGNAAVTNLLAHASVPIRRPRPSPRVVQRDPLSAADDPEGYTQPSGVRNVKGTELTRVEVHDLEIPGADAGDKSTRLGVAGGFQDSYGKSDTPSSETKMTNEESPAHMAVVIMPDKVDPARPIQVVLQFHGFGFRQTPHAHDPYAGYLVASGQTASAKGTVRDVDQEHWEQQISAVMADRGAGQPQIVAILVQGRGNSFFGNVPTYAYVNEVLGRIGLGGKSYSIVLSAHSGGGFALADRVKSGDADAASTKTLSQDPARAKSANAADMVVMFDAEASNAVIGWVVKQIKALATALTAPSADTKAILNASPRFRAYFVSKALDGSYPAAYNTAALKLRAALDALPAALRELRPGEVNVPDLFRIIEVKRAGASHEHLIGAVPDPHKKPDEEAKIGALADSLHATTDPTFDRNDSYTPHDR